MITSDQVFDKTLGQILGDDDPDYLRMKDLVKGALFSRYPGRREYCKMELIKGFKQQVSVETETGNGIIYAYMKLETIPGYILVGRYFENAPWFEDVPNKEDMKKWPKI